MDDAEEHFFFIHPGSCVNAGSHFSAVFSALYGNIQEDANSTGPGERNVCFVGVISANLLPQNIPCLGSDSKKNTGTSSREPLDFIANYKKLF